MDGRYQQFCPVAKAAEVLTRRWTPLVVRELLCGSTRFNDIRRGVPRMSASLLSQRLKELEDAGVVVRSAAANGDHAEYRLTEAGEELRPIIMQMGFWGRRWIQQEVSREDLDVGLLMWDIRRRIDVERLPERRVVVRFDFEDAPDGLDVFWLVLEPEEADLCVKDPGHPVDLEVYTDVLTLTQIWMGDVRFGDALSHEAIRLRGPSQLRRAFPEWLQLSSLAKVERPATN